VLMHGSAIHASMFRPQTPPSHRHCLLACRHACIPRRFDEKENYRLWYDHMQESHLELVAMVLPSSISNRQIYSYPIKFQSTPLCTDRQTVPSTLLQSHQIILPRPQDHDVFNFDHLSFAAGPSRLCTPACHARYVYRSHKIPTVASMYACTYSTHPTNTTTQTSL
jgi:hypothetical protein